MININSQLSALKQIRRSFQAKVESLEGSTIVNTFNHTDKLIGFDVERLGLEGKFFGFGVSQKATVKLSDVEREINITTANTLRLRITAVSTSTGTLVPWPLFRVAEVNRDENTNELTVVAYDDLETAKKHYIKDLELTIPYTIQDVAAAIATQLGLTLDIRSNETNWTVSYPTGANFDGAETLREVLDNIADATQTIYFIDRNSNLVFLRLSDATDPVLTIGKSEYFTLTSETPRTITGIVSATELGDNVGTNLIVNDGSTQYVRDNPFWELRGDLPILLADALDNVARLTIHQFSCDWRGNFCLEPGDKIALVTKDDLTITSFVVNDSISYDGGLSQMTSWKYGEEETEHSNPSTLGEALKKTYARVDKVNKEIEIVAGETATIKLTSDTIQSTVTRMDDEMSAIASSVSNKTTPEDVTIAIQQAMNNGVEAVTTTTGFTFNETGLTVSKSGSEISTTITEDGMTVYRDNDAVLEANNEGVKAQDLHATTFLIIGTNSRFEDYGGRTGCFWIGG